MLLATRCPFCETVFRLQPAQLSLRRGLVRCGHCHEVFDASSSLFDIPEGGDFASARPVDAAAAMGALPGVSPPAPDFSSQTWDPRAPVADASIDEELLHRTGSVPVTSPVAAAHVAPDHEPYLPDAPLDPFAYDIDPPAEHAHAPLPQPAPPVAEPEEAPQVWRKTERASAFTDDEPVLRESASLHGVPDNEPYFGTAGVGAAGVGATTAPNPASPPTSFGAAAATSGEPFTVRPVDDGVDPFPVVRETRPAERGRLGWIIGGSIVALLLVVALLAQLAWWQRETVLVYFPHAQPLYVKACAQLGCQITPPHDIDGLQVEPSDLRQIDGPHKLELKMPLRNRFNLALAYPAIELTLLDAQNNVAIRRVLWPQDYVAPGTTIANGLAAHTTETMIVHLDTGNAVASNFRVQIFYP
ncbi:zinc-ribbon and DUF3426 domain-containing protein [Paraburkholderia sp. BCC1886]|uniref:zinc-ribbon and DUF3426 domain-containing protein n=1 Tax=Paraburkholderia sp. BCC1886 TaxID=2562670 RepID=UPI001183CFBB|nr:zinc-ribbon and DUF3426 domain-containing protein [Paraburkholderia sp. BCC1886]